MGLKIEAVRPGRSIGWLSPPSDFLLPGRVPQNNRENCVLPLVCCPPACFISTLWPSRNFHPAWCHPPPPRARSTLLYVCTRLVAAAASLQNTREKIRILLDTAVLIPTKCTTRYLYPNVQYVEFISTVSRTCPRYSLEENRTRPTDSFSW